MKAPPRERWLRIFRRQIELGKIEVDPEERPALIAFLTKTIDGRLKIPAEAMATLPKVWEAFGRNFESALEMSEHLGGMFRRDTPGDLKKLLAMTFLRAAEETGKEMRCHFSSAGGGEKSGPTRKDKANTEWRNGADRLAKKIGARKRAQPLSVAELARRIIKQWPDDNKGSEFPRDHKTLERMIAKMPR
jgi:hypothetical protein